MCETDQEEFAELGKAILWGLRLTSKKHEARQLRIDIDIDENQVPHMVMAIRDNTNGSYCRVLIWPMSDVGRLYFSQPIRDKDDE